MEWKDIAISMNKKERILETDNFVFVHKEYSGMNKDTIKRLYVRKKGEVIESVVNEYINFDDCDRIIIAKFPEEFKGNVEPT